jgi:hypothetical protein
LDIVTNQASIVLDGASSRLWNATTNTSALKNLATNGSQGSIALRNSQTLGTLGNFTNQGLVDIGSSASFVVGPTGNGLYSQTGGKTIVDGLLDAEVLELKGGRLEGVGELAANLNNMGGVVAPGSPTGELLVSGNYTQSAAGTLEIVLSGTQLGSFGKFQVTGTGSLNGTLLLTFLTGFTVADGAIFTIANFQAGLFGAFSSVDFAGALTGFDSVDLVYGPKALRLRFHVGMIALRTRSVPEPTTWMLMGVGFLALGMRSARWRRRGVVGS